MNEQAPIQQNPKKSGGGCGKIAIGCGIALVVAVIVIAGCAWYAIHHAKSWIASGVSIAFNQAIEQSSLPEEQKKIIIGRADHLKEQFVAGDLTLDQIATGLEKVNIQGLIVAGITQTVGSGMIQSSQLSDQEKEIGLMALNRVTQGVLDGQIDFNKVGQVLAPIRQNPASDDWQLKANPTAKELKQVVDNANDLADQAGVPADVAEVDFARRVDEAFDEAFGSP